METKIKKEKVIEESDESSDSEFYKGKELLTDIETYLKSGVHIGTKFKSGEMRKYIFKKRKDGLMVFNIETIDQRIRMIAKLFAKYEGKDIAIICRRLYGYQAAKKMGAMIGARVITGRFIPGTFTNPRSRSFFEPKIVLLCDPATDAQALKEASENNLAIVSLAGSDSQIKNIDLILPANNKGRKSIALIFYLLTREILIERKEISKDAFTAKPEDFEQEIEEKPVEKRSFSRGRFKSRFGAKRQQRR